MSDLGNKTLIFGPHTDSQIQKGKNRVKGGRKQEKGEKEKKIIR